MFLLRFGAYGLVVLSFAMSSWRLSTFTADDSYIVARYAVNARDTGDWAFNPGERISALTSPLHSLLLRGLAHLTVQPLAPYKVLGVVAVLGSSLYLLVVFGLGRPEALPLAAVLAAPSLVLWTFGGLETPMLTAVITAMAAVAVRLQSPSGGAVWPLGLLAGLAAVTRYDAVLFAGPVLLAALLERRPSQRQRLWAAVLAVGIPSSWFAYSWLRFGAILPTSFYVKTPTSEAAVLLKNVRYMSEHLAIAGLAVVLIFAVVRLIGTGSIVETLFEEVRTRWGLQLGLVLVLAYGATMATVHMMFAFRHFTPYLGALALALLCLAKRSDDRRPNAARSSSFKAVVSTLGILIVHVAHTEALRDRSLQGLGSFGEYDAQGAAGYARDFISAMERNAADIGAHWATLGMSRPPRIWTFAAGALPYAYREAYIFEALVSFRHHCPRREKGEAPDARVWRAHADYIHAFTRHGNLPRLLAPVRAEQAQLISTHEIRFNGRDERLLVYYNPSPRENILPPGIDASCAGAPAEVN